MSLALPPPSSAVEAIVETLLLSPGFCLILMVGPSEQPTLAEWSLRLRLEPESQEVFHLDLRRDELGLDRFLDASSTGRPILFLAGLESLLDEERAEKITTMNLLRDEWGRSGVRIVLWCSKDSLDDIWRFAPDLLHWKSLLQPVEHKDLLVFDQRSYLAWCIDAFRESETDRVYAGGSMVAWKEPLLMDLPDPGSAATLFSRWVLARRRGVIVRAKTRDSRYPAKQWCRPLALRRLLDGEERPLPVIIKMSEIEAFIRGECSLESTPVGEHLWTTLFDEEHIVFVVDDGAEVDLELCERLTENPRRRAIIITSSDLDLPAWPKALVLALAVGVSMAAGRQQQDRAAQPSTRSRSLLSRGPRKRIFHALARESLNELLLACFSVEELQRFLVYRSPLLQPLLPSSTVSAAEYVSELVDTLLRLGLIDTSFFEDLLEMRPRRQAEVMEVAARFRDLGRFA